MSTGHVFLEGPITDALKHYSCIPVFSSKQKTQCMRRSQCRCVYRLSHAFSNTLTLNTSHQHTYFALNIGQAVIQHTYFSLLAFRTWYHLTRVLQEFTLSV